MPSCYIKYVISSTTAPPGRELPPAPAEGLPVPTPPQGSQSPTAPRGLNLLPLPWAPPSDCPQQDPRPGREPDCFQSREGAHPWGGVGTVSLGSRLDCWPGGGVRTAASERVGAAGLGVGVPGGYRPGGAELGLPARGCGWTAGQGAEYGLQRKPEAREGGGKLWPWGGVGTARLPSPNFLASLDPSNLTPTHPYQ